jgi:cytochrome c-type biogenesis protein CcmE
MTRKRRRLYFVMLGLLGLGAGMALVLTALQDDIVFFFSPTEIAVLHQGETILFSVTDTIESLKVSYTGLLPDLFREGQGVVAEGHMNTEGIFIASNVLAKHDENYMPREVADALKASGQWKEGEPLPPAAVRNN